MVTAVALTRRTGTSAGSLVSEDEQAATRQAAVRRERSWVERKAMSKSDDGEGGREWTISTIDRTHATAPFRHFVHIRPDWREKPLFPVSAPVSSRSS